MNDFKRDIARIQELVGNSFTATGRLAALSDEEHTKTQKCLDQTIREFEKATLELRSLCEKYTAPHSVAGRKPFLPHREITGYVEIIEYQWLHIQVNTLLPSTSRQVPLWLSDTIIKLLDDYENGGHSLPYYKHALMVIDERSDITGRHVFDQDNKGWKAISNAMKGRLVPDDDQYTLGIVLMSSRSKDDVCHITILDRADAADFFAAQASDGMIPPMY